MFEHWEVLKVQNWGCHSTQKVLNHKQQEIIIIGKISVKK